MLQGSYYLCYVHSQFHRISYVATYIATHIDSCILIIEFSESVANKDAVTDHFKQ